MQPMGAFPQANLTETSEKGSDQDLTPDIVSASRHRLRNMLDSWTGSETFGQATRLK